MASSKIPRRVFLKSLGLLLLVSGCSSEAISSLVSEPTATPLPTPTPTPLPRADAVSQTYLNSWSQGDFMTMYSLLAPDSQVRLSQEQFRYYYTTAMLEATVTAIKTQLQSLLHEGPQATAIFTSTWETSLFGPITANNQMRLKFLEGRWGIEWQPTLVLPQLGEGVTLAFLSEQPTRGNIYDKNFHALATQGEMVTVGLIPEYLEDQKLTLETIAQITGVSPEKITKSLAAAQPDWFVPVADINFETSLQYDNLFNNLPGVDRRARTVRTYSDGDTASHIIGYMGAIPADRKAEYLAKGYQGDELVGLSGIESWAEPYLAGQHGGRLVTLSPPPGRQVLSELGTVTAQAGRSAYLTLDTLFQSHLEHLLGEQRGAIVVMEPNTGAIYGMASYPRYKPAVFTTGFDVDSWAELYTRADRPLLNRATQGLYPPGSVFKIASLIAGLGSEIGLQPDTSFVCTGKWQGLGPAFEKRCWLEHGHGKISLIDGLTQSCNVVFYEVGLALHRSDPQRLPDWARKLGLGDRTGLLGLEESAGVIPDEVWKQANFNQPLFDGDAVNTAIGQGFTLVTPLQIVRLLAAIGNGGRLVRPRLVDRIVSLSGEEQKFEPETQQTLPVSPEILALIQKSLEDITSGARGTARAAFQGINYTVAGKTGTAESGQKNPHAWFAGYAPADEPRVAIVVVLEEAGEGSKVAAPLFRQVLEAFFEWEASQT